VFWDIVYFCTGIELEEETDVPILKVEMRKNHEDGQSRFL
jgi:hypothetical protein